jgi:hypothetical protein
MFTFNRIESRTAGLIVLTAVFCGRLLAAG